jgi:hypothetical protein
MRYAYIDPNKEEAAVVCLSIVNAMQPTTVIMETVLQWGNASVLSPGVVTRRLGSCPRPEDWDLGKVRRQSGRQPCTARPCCYLSQRGKANNHAGRSPMYSHNGNLTSHFHAASVFSGSGRGSVVQRTLKRNLGPIRVATSLFLRITAKIEVMSRFIGLLLRL